MVRVQAEGGHLHWTRFVEVDSEAVAQVVAHTPEFGATCRRMTDMRVPHSVRTGRPTLGTENCKHIVQRRTEPTGQRVDVPPRRAMFLEQLLPLLSGSCAASMSGKARA